MLERLKKHFASSIPCIQGHPYFHAVTGAMFCRTDGHSYEAIASALLVVCLHNYVARLQLAHLLRISSLSFLTLDAIPQGQPSKPWPSQRQAFRRRGQSSRRCWERRRKRSERRYNRRQRFLLFRLPQGNRHAQLVLGLAAWAPTKPSTSKMREPGKTFGASEVQGS